MWALVIVLRGHPVDRSIYEDEISIVDERDFWTYATQRQEPPMRAQDFLGAKFMEDYQKGIDELKAGDAMTFRFIKGEDKSSWMATPADPLRTDPPTVYLLNLGLSSMNAPLDIRVLDDIGLSNPLAARQPRIVEGRIGHDKSLEMSWQVADSAADIDETPPWIDKYEATKARAALADADFQKLFATYREPLTWDRFWKNIKFSLTDGRTLAFSSDPSDYLH